jgi:hypothetical protein
MYIVIHKYIVLNSFTYFYILIFTVELVVGRKLVHGSSVSFSILR